MMMRSILKLMPATAIMTLILMTGVALGRLVGSHMDYFNYRNEWVSIGQERVGHAALLLKLKVLRGQTNLTFYEAMDHIWMVSTNEPTWWEQTERE